MTSTLHLTLPKDIAQTDSPSPRSGRALHILTLTPFFPFASNPVYGSYVSEPIERFAEFNLRSTVIGVSPLHRKRRRPLPSAAAEWLRYFTIPGNFGLTTAGFFLYHRLIPFVQQLHRNNAIDLIHAHATLPCAHAALLLSERSGIPFVVTIHGLDVFNNCFEPGTSAAERRAKLSAKIYSRASSVVCVSRMIEEILQNGMPRPVASCVIYNGVDPQMFFPEETPVTDRPPTILMVGNLLRGKGHEVVLKALAQIKPEFPTLRCAIIGEGQDQSLFADLARQLGIANKISFLGRQDRQAVATAMRECTIFALPSRFEGLGCAYLEAMASAKPVIACEGQGIGEVIQHGKNGWLIPIDGISEMADALRQLLCSPDLRTCLGTNARQTILAGFTLSDQVRRLSDLYRGVAKS
ncbi:MAG: glycosyltransferase [Terriglobales bacterium]